MTRYTVFIHEEILVSAPKSGAQRRLVMDCIRRLGDDPFRNADYTETDEAGRELAVKIAGHFAITYYVDHAVKEVKVIDVRPAGR
jgi:mRNA-degrading endonuclease RelE of RelBE toxin-antitoxin system